MEPFDFLRYLANIGVPLCILAPAAGKGVRGTRIAKTLLGRRAGQVLIASYVFLSVAASWMLRKEMVSGEQLVRTAPALAAIAAASALDNRYPIVTLEPLVIQLYGGLATTIIALPFLTPELVSSYGGRVLYVRQDHYEDDINRRRYAEGFSALPETEVIELRKGSNWTVSAMGARDPSFDAPAGLQAK